MSRVSFLPRLGTANEADYSHLAGVALELADQVEADEARIKRAILDALEDGSVDRAVQIVRHWQSAPPSEVASAL